MMRTLSLVIVCLFFSATGIADEITFIAGLDPGHRPAQAPSITTVQHSETWLNQALHGITAPYPKSLEFLYDQGDWFTPFNRPGMHGHYDLRSWHNQ